jgi:hypothetical protein
MTFKGFIRLSSADVSLVGVVVSVIRLEPNIISMNLESISPVRSMPSLLIFILHHENTGSPPVKKRFIREVNIRMNHTGLRPLRIYLKGTFDTSVAESRKIKAHIYTAGDL